MALYPVERVFQKTSLTRLGGGLLHSFCPDSVFFFFASACLPNWYTCSLVLISTTCRDPTMLPSNAMQCMCAEACNPRDTGGACPLSLHPSNQDHSDEQLQNYSQPAVTWAPLGLHRLRCELEQRAVCAGPLPTVVCTVLSPFETAMVLGEAEFATQAPLIFTVFRNSKKVAIFLTQGGALPSFL